MADAITTKNITSVDEVQSVDNTDKVFVNDNGSFKQISVSNLMKQAPSGVTEETDPTVSEWAKQPTKPSYTADEVGALPVGTKIPTKTSDLTNDSGYLTQIPEEYVTETELGQKGYVIEDDIPEKLPSPGTLTFTGAVNDTYDGSVNKTINIPTGGGEGGTTDYNDLTNKPKLNGVTLEGNKTLDQIGAVQKNQGSGNSGKYLIVGDDGEIILSNEPINNNSLPSGGTTGQVLTKRSDTDGDATWVELSAYSQIEKISKKIFSGEIKKIILIGDSITDGYGGTGYNGNKTYGYLNTAGYCWANILKKYLSDRFQIETDNYGKYNSKIDEQFQIIQSNIISGNYDLCVWLSGTNNRVDSSTFQSYKTILPQAINYLKDNIDDFVIISAIPATKDDEAGRGHKGYEIDEVALSSCVAENCCFSSGYRKFCDYIELTNTDIASCFSDHVHPNDLGYYILFKIICNILNIPLDPYTNYKIDGGYWEAEDPGGSEGSDKVLIDTYNKGGQPFVSWGDGVIPVILTARYDSNSHSTIYSGKTIKTIKFNLGESGNSGTITIGKLDLTLPRNQANINITEEMQYTIDSDGLVDLGDGITLGSTETLTIGREADTARLIYYTNATSDDNIMTCRLYAVESNQISRSTTGIPIIVTI